MRRGSQRQRERRTPPWEQTAGSDRPRSMVSDTSTSAGFLRQHLDKDLRTATPSRLQMQGAILLDVVNRQQPAILEFLACGTTLRVWRDAFLALDIRSHDAEGVGRLNVRHDFSLQSGRGSACHHTGATPGARWNPLQVVTRQLPANLEFPARHCWSGGWRSLSWILRNTSAGCLPSGCRKQNCGFCKTFETPFLFTSTPDTVGAWMAQTSAEAKAARCHH